MQYSKQSFESFGKNKKKQKRVSEVYIMSTFKYCPLIWVFSGKTENKSINNIYKHILRLIYDTEDELSIWHASNMLQRKSSVE